MGKEAKEIKKITVGLIFIWIFGILFILAGVGIIAQGSYISGILIMLCSAMIIPYFNKIVAEKFHFEISGGIKFGLVIVIFVLMGIAMSHSSNSKNIGTNENSILSPKVVETTPKEEIKTYFLGDTIQAGDFKWKITKVSTTNEIGQDVMGTFFGKKADGLFVILDVEVENTGNSAEYLTDSYIKLVDSQNREFSPNPVAAIYLKPEGSALVFAQINPGITKKGKIVYDVPENVKNFNVKITSSLFSSRIYNVKITI